MRSTTLLASTAFCVAMTAAFPALAQSTAYLARKVGDSYVFDVAVPPKTLAVITDPASSCYNTIESTVTSGGKSYTVRTTEISWDKNLPISKGRFAFSDKGGFGAGCWQTVDIDDTDWAKFQTAVEAMAVTDWGPSRAVLYHRPAEKGDATLTLTAQDVATKLAAPFKAVPLPTTPLAGESANGLKLRQAIVTQLNTVKPGTLFPDDMVLIPDDLEAARKAMLNYGNAERLNPEFRAKIPGARPVEKGKPFMLGDKAFDVVDQGDLTLDATLNETAQWFAEALAAGKGNAHTFTGTWTEEGATIPMATLGDRSKKFKTGDLAGEVAGSSDAGGFPYGWMASNTHLAWWFGIGGPYKQVGFGAARDRKGMWHYVGVAKK